MVSSWAPPDSRAIVFGELSADGSEICIIVSGEPYQIHQAATQLSWCTPRGKIIADGHALTMPCTWPTVAQLAMTFRTQWQAGGALREWIMREIARRTTWTDHPLRYRLPDGLELKPWQPIAVRQIAHIGCLLEDEPRLGKTVSTIVGLCERQCWGHQVLPIVVICPPSVVTSWVREFQKWAPHLRTVAWRGGNKEERRLLVGRHDVYVASYAICARDAPAPPPITAAPLLRIKPRTVIIDEYHWISNPEAKRTLATQRIARQADLVIPLSGTPFLHDFSGTQPTLDVFEPCAFPSKERLADRYCLERPVDYGRKIVGIRPEMEAELRACFLGRQLRRARQDVAVDLSEITYSTRVIEIPPRYRKMYDDMEDKMLAELDSGEELSVMSTMLKMNRLQYLAASACDVSYTWTDDPRTGEPVKHTHVHPILPSWKIDAMLDVLAELAWPAIAFGVSRPLMELAGQEADKAGARVGYVIGGQTTRCRDRDIDAFQAGKLDLLCVVIEAGGTGLTLNAAGTEIFLQRHCSYVQSKQAQDRGIGDRHPTLDVVDIFADNTIDQRIREILHNKAGQLSQYFADPRIVRELFGGRLKPKREKKAS